MWDEILLLNFALTFVGTSFIPGLAVAGTNHRRRLLAIRYHSPISVVYWAWNWNLKRKRKLIVKAVARNSSWSDQTVGYDLLPHYFHIVPCFKSTGAARRRNGQCHDMSRIYMHHEVNVN